MLNYEEKEQAMKQLELFICKEVNKIFNYMQSEKEDILQDARLLVFKALDNYDSSRGELTTFCYQVLHTGLIDIIRKKYQVWYKTDVVDAETLDVYQTNEVDYASAYLFDKLEEIVSKNRSKFTKRELLFLDLFLEKKTLEEIDNILGITKNNRFVLVHNLKNKLKSIIGVN